MADPDQIARDVDVMQLQQVRNCSKFCVIIVEMSRMLLNWHYPSHTKPDFENLSCDE